MKIEIEFTSSVSAKLTIDGRKMRVESVPGMVTLKGIESPRLENTLGGIVADALYGTVAQIQQAWASASEIDVDCETWDMLSEEAADAASDRLW
jgi:hypothetical protein